MTTPITTPTDVSPFSIVSNITPFTYRDGLTYLQILENFRKYINNYLIPAVAEYGGDIKEYVDAIVEGIINDSVEANDPIVAELVNDADSLTRAALDAIYATIADLTAVEGSVDAIVAELSGRLSTASLDAAYVNTSEFSTLWKASRNRETVYNILDYGAVDNSAVSSSVAINAALADAHSHGGGTIIFPKGNYGVTTDIILKPNIQIVGYGATLHRTANVGFTVRNWETGDTSTGGYTGYSNITIEGVTFDAHGDTIPQAVNTLTFDHCENIKVINCTFLRNPGYHALEFSGVKNAVVLHSQFLGYVPVAGLDMKEAIQIDVTNANADAGQKDNTYSRNITIDGNTFDGFGSLKANTVAVGSHSVGSDNGRYRGIRIVNNRVKSTLFGIHASFWLNPIIANNYFDGNDWALDTNGSAIQVDNTEGAVITGNTVDGPYAFGYNVTTESKYATISSNTVNGAQIGIRSASNGNVIDGNTTHNTANYGISIDGATDTICTGNTVNGAGYNAGGNSAIRVTGSSVRAIISENIARPHGYAGGTEVPVAVSSDATSSGIIVRNNDFSGIAQDISGSNVDNSVLQGSGNKFGALTWGITSDSWSARVSITPDAANTVKSKIITFPAGLFKSIPVVQVQAESSLPNTVVTSVSNITVSDCTVYLIRPDTNVTTISLTAISRSTASTL